MSPAAAILEGSVTRCEKEGEDVKIPTITDDPCITCTCRNMEVQCEKRKCQNLEGCHTILFDGPSSRCCETCKGCRYNGTVYQSGQLWTAKHDSCQHFSCRAGVVTQSKVQCYVPCSDPEPVSGHCCPSCEGCFLDGREYREGETFSLTSDPCVQCRCRGGRVSCHKTACPVLNCPPEVIYTPEGECCPKCRGMRRIFDLPNACYFAKRVYFNGTQFDPEPCTTCKCVRGTAVCEAESCPPLDCPPGERFHNPGDCCQRCPVRRDCSFQGTVYKHRQEWRPRMCTHCTCDDGVTYCQRERCSNALWCPQGYKLKFETGACCPKCVEHDAVCTVFGDPHYKTFDGKMYNFQGTCKYLLVRECTRRRDFTIKVRNGVRHSSGFAWTQMLVVFIDSTRVSLLQNLRVKIDRKRASLPYRGAEGLLVRRAGNSVVLTSERGLKVVWDGDSFLEVTVDSKYKGRLCGLCGDYNGVPTDDLTGRDGVLYQDGESFGATWRVGGKAACRPAPRGVIAESPCVRDPEARLKASEACAVLTESVFALCRLQVKAQPYLDSCRTDMCDCPEGRHCACESVQAYAHQCARSGILIDWERLADCVDPARGCPDGSVYSKCTSACPRTCENVNKVVTCPKPCVPGCRCKRHKVWHAGKCISARRCPLA